MAVLARVVLISALLGLVACRGTFDEWRKQVIMRCSTRNAVHTDTGRLCASRPHCIC